MAWDLTDLRTRITTRATRAVQTAAPRLESELKRTSPVKTGTMRGRTTVAAAGLTATATIDTGYASYVREGTPPHTITAKRAAVLSFFWPRVGRQVFFRTVNHPGTQPNPWYNTAINRWSTLVGEALTNE